VLPYAVSETTQVGLVTKLDGRHWMYRSSTHRLDVIKMCEDCRVVVLTEDGLDPDGAPARPKVLTTDDYLRERKVEQPK
jgi:hypothetical protein